MPDLVRRWLLAGSSALVLTGCATRVSTIDNYVAEGGPKLPRPQTVLVDDFGLDPQAVELDQGLRARLQRQVDGEPLSEDQQKIADEVQSAIADTLVEEIVAMGLTAVRATPGTPRRAGDIIVGGRITRIDGGNATRRNLVGFGAGKSEVFADAAVYEAAPGGGTRLLRTYDASANSGRTPGLGVGAASAAGGQVAAAAAGTALGTISRARSGLPKDGEHLARRVALNLGEFFSQQGWIDPSRVPTISR